MNKQKINNISLFIVLVSGIVAVLLNLLLPQELAEEVAEEEEINVEVIDTEKQDHKGE